MNYVVDTHSLVWHFTNDPRLGEQARNAFEQTLKEGALIVPTVVLAEIMYILQKGRIPLSFEDTVARIAEYANYRICDLTLEILKVAGDIKADLEMHDKLIVATAIFTGASLITKDSAIAQLQLVNTVW